MVWEIFAGLAKACGVEQYFDFTVQELSKAQIESTGLSYDAVYREGIAFYPEAEFEYDKPVKWKTKSGKIDFKSDAFAKGGFDAVPKWIEPAVMPGEGEFRIVDGKQAVHSHTQTANIDCLMHLTKKYDLTRAWINASEAAKLGIADGDEIEISNDMHTARVRAKVTERVNPTTIFIPGHYGCSAKDLHTAYGVGVRPMDFVKFQTDAYGASMTHEAVVKVKKVGA